MEEWEAQVRNIENFNKMEYFMGQEGENMQYDQDFKNEETIENGQVFDYQMEHNQDIQPKGSLLGNLPPLNPGQVPDTNKFTSHGTIGSNKEIKGDEPPTVEGYNYSLVQMDDFLKDQGLFNKDSTNLVNNYYANLSMMAPQKA